MARRRPPIPIVVEAAPSGTELRSIVVSWRAACTDGSNHTDAGELDVAEDMPGFSPAPDELLMTRNARGRFAGTQCATADLGDATGAVVVQVAGTLKRERASQLPSGGFGAPFGDDQVLDDGTRRRWDYRIKGRIGRTSAKGSLHVKVADRNTAGATTDACDTDAVTWKAATG